MISVIVCAYNSEKTLEACLKSICQTELQETYELIVVNDGSLDRSLEIANQYADHIIDYPENRRESYARNAGAHAAKGDIFVFIDSDIVVKPDTIRRIFDYLSAHPNVAAVTGLLSCEHPNRDFFSQYKNLYMRYYFSLLPERIDFIYGSVFAVRKEAWEPFDTRLPFAADTEWGRRLVRHGKRVSFLRDLEVVHLKKYSLGGLVRNDFRISFWWAVIFFRDAGWGQLGKGGVGFAHASKNQLLSLLSMAGIFVLCALGLFGVPAEIPFFVLLIFWFFLNGGFLTFLTRSRGLVFGLISLVVIPLNEIVKLTGIVSGFVVFVSKYLFSKTWRAWANKGRYPF